MLGKGLGPLPPEYFLSELITSVQTINYNPNSFVPSPYILFPDDKLVFGWANQSFSGTGDYWDTTKTVSPGTPGHSLDGDTERAAHDAQLVIAPGKGKIVFYGSLLKHGKEFHQSTNQLLTSDAIHEDVRSNQNPMGQSDVLDQLEAQYYQLYSGSYIDRAFGSFDPAQRSLP